MVHQLIYRSLSIHPRGHISDLDILRAAMARNTECGITGYLIRSSSTFLQALEGATDAVAHIYDLIRKDTRNAQHQVLIAEDREARDFAGWSMGYTDMSSTLALPRLLNGSEARDLLLAASRNSP